MKLVGGLGRQIGFKPVSDDKRPARQKFI